MSRVATSSASSRRRVPEKKASRSLRRIWVLMRPGEFSTELSKRGLSAGYSFNREVDLFFDYHPLDMPYRKGAVFRDVLYRYLVVFIYCRESVVEFDLFLLAGYIKNTFDLKQDEIRMREKELSDYYTALALHEISHYVICPYDMITNAKLVKAALKHVDTDLAPIVVNIFKISVGLNKYCICINCNIYPCLYCRMILWNVYYCC